MELSYYLNNVWVIVSAALVFLMHAGFACVESGFTQSKNTANIIMKNFMTIAIGSLCFYIIGFGLMFGDSINGIISKPAVGNIFELEGNAGNIDKYVYFFFQAVFAATCATIVSGAVAERTKFEVYLMFCVVMCVCIYPITGHWIWGGGWLAELGFTDFAGSTAVHAVGGFSALIGAKIVGARAGKYEFKKIKPIPPHSIPLGALGVLLLWFGWFGFNAGSTISAIDTSIGLICVNTLLAGAAGALGTMAFSWIKTKRADVGLTLNGCLAGLVAITAGCNCVSPFIAVIIGVVAGIIMTLAVGLFDNILKIDDPVGAISVHGMCGAFGTICVGLFANIDITGDGIVDGLFYGGGFAQTGIQILGVMCCITFAMVISFIFFIITDKVIGLRVHRRHERAGLDTIEHGINAYCNSETDTNPYSNTDIFEI